MLASNNVSRVIGSVAFGGAFIAVLTSQWALQQQLAPLVSKVDQINVKLEDCNDSMSSLNDSLSRMDGSLSRMEDSMSKIDGSMSRIQDLADANSQKMDAILANLKR